MNGLPIQLVGSALSGLNVESCVHSCQGSPCGAGICSPHLDTFSCQCPLGWGGESCSTPTPDSSPVPGSTPTPDSSTIPGSTPTPDSYTIPGKVVLLQYQELEQK